MFGLSSGRDQVIAGEGDTLKFDAGIVPEDIKLKREGSDLIVTINGAIDQVVVKNLLQINFLGLGLQEFGPSSFRVETNGDNRWWS